MTRSTYTVTATRGHRRWVLQCVEVPGALSEVTRLEDAAETIREAIAWVAKVPEDSFDIDVQPELPPQAVAHLAVAERLREESRAANAAAAVEVRTAARELADAGLPLRDIGTVLGVSFQRAGQLVRSA